MTRTVFIDSDVILDVAMAREPFFDASRTVLAMAETNRIIGTTSANCIATIYYMTRKAGGDEKARRFISSLVRTISIIPVDRQNALDALKSKFSDFEDALQNCSATEHQCEYIVTRNTEDYRHSELKIATPEEFVKMYPSYCTN